MWSLIKSNLDFYPQLLSINCSFDNGSWWIKMSNNTQQKVELTIQCQISETYWLLISQFKKFTVNWNSYIQGLRIKYQYNFCNKCLVQGWFQFLSKGFLSYAQTTPATNIIFISSQLNPSTTSSLSKRNKKEGAQFYS